jgi:DNA (cytosine-5)-methyltransferase 1
LIASTLKSQRGKDGGGIGPEETLVAGPLGGGNDGIGRRSEDDPNLVTAFAWQQGDADTNYVAAPLMFGSSRGGPNSLRPGFTGDEHIVAAPLSHWSNPNSNTRQTASVRRLTPTECERLQGLPDGWTQLGDTADSKRYAALGDAVTVSVAEWIGRRILEADSA